MKKKFRYLLLLLALVFVLGACGKKSSDKKDSGIDSSSENSSSDSSTGKDSSAIDALPTAQPITEKDIPTEGPDNTDTSPVDIEDPKLDELLGKLTKEEKIYQLFIVTPEQLVDVDVVTRAGAMTKNAFNNKPVGGLIYFPKNFESANQIKEMMKNMQDYSNTRLGLPIFLGVDEEGGTVSRVVESGKAGVTNVGNMSDIGATGDANKAYEAGKAIGTYLHDLGFNLDFAPVADVLSNAENESLKLRSFGTDPKTVSEMAVSFARGLSENNIIACFKHFPGNGAVKEDTHDGAAAVTKSLDELKNSDLLPFKAAIEAGADFIMVGHITLSGIAKDDAPASLSPEVITDILRNDMQYDGIVITDSLSMKSVTDKYGADNAAVMAIKAGADMILLPADFNTAYTAVLNAVNNGEITEERLNQSVKRILKLKLAMTET